jgi:hypothetical protein
MRLDHTDKVWGRESITTDARPAMARVSVQNTPSASKLAEAQIHAILTLATALDSGSREWLDVGRYQAQQLTREWTE